MEFGNRLKLLRNERYLTQKELASATGLSLSAIAKWETGLREPGASMVVLLAQYFDVTTDYLLGLED